MKGVGLLSLALIGLALPLYAEGTPHACLAAESQLVRVAAPDASRNPLGTLPLATAEAASGGRFLVSKVLASASVDMRGSGVTEALACTLVYYHASVRPDDYKVLTQYTKI